MSEAPTPDQAAIAAPVPVPAVPGPAPLTIEQFQAALPDRIKKSVNQELVDRVNAVLNEPEMYEAYRENLLSYGRVMQDGRWTVAEYLSAVKYVSHKLMGATNIDAYSKTFPDKITRFTAQGVQAKDIASYVTAYNKSKLVNTIFEQTLIPVHVLNQDLFQKGINKLADLMMSANSEKVQVEAAIGLINATKAPDIKKVELAITNKEDSSISVLRQATMDLARQQRELLQAGAVTAKDMAHQRVVQSDADVVDVQAKVLP
jgi:hypothetical protein